MPETPLPAGPTATDPAAAGVWSELGGAGDLVICASADGAIQYVSPDCQAMGYEPADLVGRTGLDFVHPDDRPRFVVNHRSLVQSGEPVDPDLRLHRFRRADGSWVWLKGHPSIRPTQDGRSGDIINVFRPVSEAEAAAILSQA